MPAIGDYRTRFNRNYIWVQPGQGPGTWRLTADDPEAPAPTPDAASYELTVDSNSPSILVGQLVYVTTVGTAALASSTSITTGRPIGVAVTAAGPNQLINVGTNRIIQITNVSDIVEGAPLSLETGKYYRLSSEAGKFTRTPDTSTAGSVLVQVGLATSSSEMQIEQAHYLQ